MALGVETLAISTETSLGVKEGVRISQRILRAVERNNRDDPQADVKLGSAAGRLRDSGAKKTVALTWIKSKFAMRFDPSMQFKEIEFLYVKDTFNWLSDEKGYESFKEGDTPFLWVCGAPGMGKSFMAYWIIKQLQNFCRAESTTTVAYFFFQEEHEDRRSVEVMLRSLIIQMAQANGAYCAEAASQLRRDEASGFYDDYEEPQLWAKYFAARYSKDSSSRVILVLDGIDEVGAADQSKLVDMLLQIRKDELNIQVVLTGRPNIAPTIKVFEPDTIEVTKAKVTKKSGDLWKIILARCKKLPKLKRLRPQLWKTIAIKLKQKADSMISRMFLAPSILIYLPCLGILYVEHMLRRLNNLGRESLILKELENLPLDLRQLYSQLLSEFQIHRSDEETAAFKKLFAWLAYSKRPLELGEASSLVTLVCGSKSVLLEQEVEGRASRY